MSYVLHSDGSATLSGRTVPVPGTISAEAAQSIVDANNRPAGPGGPLAPRRAQLDAQMRMLNDVARSLYPVDITEVKIAGVRCHLVRPPEGAGERSGKVLVNLHAGGFVTGSGSLVEAIPVAARTNSTVIAVDYRLAPEHPYPAAVDDVVAVWRSVLEHHPAADVALYGTSAGAFLTAQAVMRFRHEGLDLPACTGIFSGGGDLTDLGDSAAIFNFGGFAGDPIVPYSDGADASDTGSYLRGADPTDPLVSPLRGDLSHFPPTLLVTSTRDAILSATALMHRALRRDGVPAELAVFEALPHGFWFHLGLPETHEALDLMVRFFGTHLGIPTR
jgi:monoterpene epsilon-lactone hydrolase